MPYLKSHFDSVHFMLASLGILVHVELY